MIEAVDLGIGRKYPACTIAASTFRLMKHLSRQVALSGLFNVALAASAQDPSPALIGYWHNWNDASAPYIQLDQIDPRYNVIEVSFAVPAAGTSHQMEFVPSETTQGILAAQVASLQTEGKKVLISIGGANAAVHLDSDTERDEFVSALLSIINEYGFDGLDIDLEGSSVAITGGTITAPTDASILRLIDAVNTIADSFESQNGTHMMLTMAPETAYVQGGMSAFGGIWGAYLPIIHALRDRLDILQVQLYNSGSMYGLDGAIYEQGTADFIVSQTEAVIQGFNTGGGFFAGLPPEKIAVGLPACNAAAGGGFTDTATVRAAMEYLLGTGPQPGAYTLVQPGGYPALRGMMTWSINWDAVSTCDGVYSYAENFERTFLDPSTGVASVPEAAMLISPNPVNDVLRFSVPVHGPVIIRDLSGRVVQYASGNGAIWTVDVRALPNGMYVLDGAEHLPTRFMKD